MIPGAEYEESQLGKFNTQRNIEGRIGHKELVCNLRKECVEQRVMIKYRPCIEQQDMRCGGP